MLLLLSVITGAMGVQQGYAGNEQIEKSDLDLPSQEDFESDSTELPEFVADGYSRLAANMLHGMTGIVMWAHSHGYAFGQLVQWLPQPVVGFGTVAVSYGSLLGFAIWKLRQVTQVARDTR